MHKHPGSWLPRAHQGDWQPQYKSGDHIKVEFEGRNGMPGEWMWSIVQSRDDNRRIVYAVLDTGIAAEEIKLELEVSDSIGAASPDKPTFVRWVAAELNVNVSTSR